MTCYRLLSLVAILITHSSSAQYLYPKQQNGKFGYIDTLRQWEIPAQFDQAGFYANKKAIATKKDSLFLIISKDQILYLPGLKNYCLLDSLHVAVQDKNGRWALADMNFKPVTEFEYTRVQVKDSLFIVWKNLNMGLMDRQYRELLPCTYISIERLPNGQFKTKSRSGESIYAYRDSMVLLKSSKNLVYTLNHPRIYQSWNKNKTQLAIYNMQGDSILACEKCSVVSSFRNFIFVQNKYGIKMIDATNGETVRSLRNISQLNIEGRAPEFLFMTSPCELFVGENSRSVIAPEDSIDRVSYVNGKFLFISRKGKWGVSDYSGTIIIPCAYERLDLLNDSLLEATAAGKKDLFYMPLLKKIMSLPPQMQVSIDENSILAFDDSGPGKLYEINSLHDVTDSAEFRSLAIIRAGKKTATISTAGMGGNIGGINTSNSRRWFYHRNRYGLLGFGDRDTLIRPRFNAVYAINDSLDIVASRCGVRPMRAIEGAGVCSVDHLYAIINNRTAKYVVAPVFFHIDIRHFRDTALTVARVMLRNGNFALIHKSDFSLVEGTECAYIANEENGYMRLFTSARFFSSSNSVEKRTGRIPQLLCTINNFWNYGPIDVRANAFVVFMVSSSSNIADRNGNLLWDKKEALKLSFVDAGKYGNFISVDHKNKFGVMSADKAMLIKNEYSYISRLLYDDRYFVLKSNNTKYGYVNNEGTELSEAVFKTVYDFSDDYAWCLRGDSMVLINKSGDILETGLHKVQVNQVTEGYTSYRTTKGWYLMDINGNQVGSKLFKKLRPFVNGSAATMHANGWGMIDRYGEWIIKPEFDQFACENTDVVVFLGKSDYHFYNRQGVFLNKVKAKGKLKPLGEHYFAMEQNGTSKIYRENGELFRKRKYRQDLRCMNDTILTVASSNLVMYSPEGKRIERYKHLGGARAFDKCILKQERNRHKENTITLMVSESQRLLHGDVFPDSMQYVNIVKPEMIFPMKLVNLNLDECFRYNAFMFEFESNSAKMFCLSDSLGNLLVEQAFLNLKYFGDGMFMASFLNQNGMLVSGVLNHYGLWIVEPKFSEIKPFHAGVAIYSKRSDFWIADSDGKLISNDVLVDYTYQGGYYCLKTEDRMAWWHPTKGWLTAFSK